jgi:hypothetical protein
MKQIEEYKKKRHDNFKQLESTAAAMKRNGEDQQHNEEEEKGIKNV